MNSKVIADKINGYLHSATVELSAWLENMLPRVTKDWWHECVVPSLSSAQKKLVAENGYVSIERLDLAMLLRVADKSWHNMRSFAYLPTSDRECIRTMIKVWNNWSLYEDDELEKDVVIRDLDTILNFFESVIITNKYTNDIVGFIREVEETEFYTLNSSRAAMPQSDISRGVIANDTTAAIQEKDRVYLTGEPETKGMVFSISEINGVKRYEVFVDGDIRTFYDGQICKVDAAPAYKWVDISTLQSSLTANEINNPSAGNLYSLNSARIDFVPYQFRPALKIIKSDEPKILIADSVGVGKTIEAGLIIKELEARNELNNILIICPKPLVAERKWELEMKRFDEDFVSLDSQELRQVISDTHRDEEWPQRYNKAIVPYSILDSRVYQGDTKRKGKNYGLLDLDPAPHFDLVIIDEAHHIRNGSLEKEKAFAYKCVRYFCEHADAVIMLTATPLQTSDDDLYTLLNLLRPDVVMDKDVFRLMARPNEFIYQCSHAVRSAADGWADQAIEALESVKTTQWGENVIARNPLFHDIMRRLKCSVITREERVRLLSDIDSLHSFNTMINRTRRKDIQDFCVRRSYTVETSFTPEQAVLHNELLSFEYEALSKLHDARSVQFMMSTIRRQAASCIFGIAPFIRDIVSRRFYQMIDDPEVDTDEFDLDGKAASSLLSIAQNVIHLAENLPQEDPKLDSVVKIITEKQKCDNNKIILFSTFRHTLAYVFKKLNALNYRVAQIDGSVKDEDRRAIRARFERCKDDPEALDILLFTEVGSEGLDYQFCDTMINYDLPWNPMRIEQRIGRIDRRGQKSEVVSIYNIITAETVDADIYSRCLSRIGVFERSIGECEEVLGSIGNQIEQIAFNAELTVEERQRKLEQMADNEVRRMQELSRLEDEERALFGFDLSNYTASREIRDADSPWLSPTFIHQLVERYLSDRLGNGQYITGGGDVKQLRLSKLARLTLLDDFKKVSNVRSGNNRRWETFLKGSEQTQRITFVPESASQEQKAFFLTPMHPLVKQAAKHFASDTTSYVQLEYRSSDIPEGSYPFSIYTWNYVGMHPSFKVVPLCEDPRVEEELVSILLEAETSVATATTVPKETWMRLEPKHIAMWQEEKARFVVEAENAANYKLESISSNFKSRKRNLEQKINSSADERIIRMYRSELQAATENYDTKVEEINARTRKADIHTKLVANGIICIRR